MAHISLWLDMSDTDLALVRAAWLSTGDVRAQPTEAQLIARAVQLAFQSAIDDELAFQVETNYALAWTSITPDTGDESGLTGVVIQGENIGLFPITSITFDGEEATDVVIIGMNEVNCTTPPGTASETPVDVVITREYGDPLTGTGVFTYTSLG